MPNQFQIKRSSVSGRVPDAANVAVGELAVNLADRQLFTKDGTGNIFLLGAGNTDRLIEGSANLFYSNARVYSNVTSLLPNYTGNIGAGNLIGNYTNTSVIAGSYSFTFDNTGNITIPGAVRTNILYANVIQGATTSNLAEGSNLYYTNARVYANISPLLTTANVAELSNLYFTNARARAALTNTDLSLHDLIVEGNLTVLGNITAINSNILVISATLQVDNKVIVLSNGAPNAAATDGSGIVIDYVNANLLYRTASDSFESNKNIIVKGNSVLTSGNTTSNLNEGTNLYYTNNRVDSFVTPKLTTANVVETTNLYYTNSRVRTAISGGTGVTYSNTTGVISIGQNVATSSSVEFKDLLVTGNVTFAGNATLLNTRSVSISDNMIYLNEAVAENITNAVGNGSNVTYTVAGTHNEQVGYVVRVTGVNPSTFNTSYVPIIAVTANTITISSNVTDSYVTGGNAFIKASANPDLGFAGGYNDGIYHHSGLFRDATDGIWKFFENYEPEPDTSIFIDTSNTTFRLANVQASGFIGNVTGTVSTLLNHTTSNLIEGTNLYYTNARVGAYLTPNFAAKANVVDLTTANVAELTNLYYTNARVYSNVIGLLNLKANVVDLTTSNVTEGTNLYYTNARVYANINPLLTTANVSEVTNLYYTNARVYSNVISLLPNYTGNIGGNIVGTTQNTIILAGSYNYVFDNTGVFSAPGTIRTNILYANIIQGATTSNIAEGSNLYYTNARVYANISPLLTTANVAEVTNLYYTNARVYSNVIGLLNLKANVVDLTTSNVTEGTNLYYTNARVYANVIGLLNNKANVVDLTTANVAELTNLYYTNARVYANISPLLTTANVAELTNLYYTNARVYSNISPLLTTANVAELTNLYYTNARVYSNVTVLLPNYSGNIGGNLIGTGSNTIVIAGSYNFTFDNTGNITVPGAVRANILYANIIQGATTSNITEGTNLYYTNARVYANISPLLTTANVAEVTNLYYTNARVYSNVIGLLNNKANVVDLTTANVAEVTNLYYTNARVYSNVIGLLNLKANVVDLTTANVAEVTNLYYTNARVYSNVIGLLNLKANVVDLTTSNVTEGTNLYYTNARVRSSISAANGINYNVTTGIITSGLQVQLVNISNVATTSVANVNTLQFDSDSGFEVLDRANGIAKVQLNSTFKYWNVLGQANLVASGLDTVRFIPGNNIVITLNTNATPQSISFDANLLGYAKTADLTTANVVELTNQYFTNARARAALSAGVGIVYNSNTGVISADTSNAFLIGRLFTGEFYGNNSTSNYNLTFVPQSANAILVFVDSVLQTPIQNYTVSSNVLTFTSPPETNAYISYRYFSSEQIDLNLSNLGDFAAYITPVANNILVYNGATSLWEPTPVANVLNSTTTQIAEGTNLYFTNARARAAISVTGSGSYDQANGIITVTGGVTTVNGANGAVVLTTTNIAEGGNLYYTNARVKSYFTAFDGNIIPSQNSVYNLGNATNRWKDLYLSGNTIDLGGTLLQSRTDGLVVNSANITTLLGNAANINFVTVNDITVNGRLYSNDITSTTITIAGDAVVTGNLIVSGNTTTLNSQTLTVADNQVVLNSNHTGSPVLDAGILVNRGSSANVDLKWNESTDRWQFTNNGTAYYNLATSTTDIEEGTNLYYTNTRVYANISPLLTTANVSEVTNLYYTNTRVYANISPLLTTANVSEVTNLYYTNSRVRSAISVSGSGSYDQANGIITVTGGVTSVNGANGTIVLNTSNISEGANLYFTNARVDARLATSNLSIFLDVSNTVPSTGQALVWSGNIWQPGTVSGGGGGSNVLLIGAQQTSIFYGDGTNTSFNMGFTPATPNNVLVYVDGINQNYPNNYTTSGQYLVFDEIPSSNSVISVKYFSTDSVYNTKFFLGTVANQEFLGDGSNTNFNLSYISGDSNQALVFVNGVIQQPSYNYNITNSVLAFTSAPDSGANIFVRTFSNSQNELVIGQLKNVSNTAPTTGQALTWLGNTWGPATLSSNVAAYQKYRYTANASQTIFAGTDDTSQILIIPSTQRMQVHLNGVLLEPTLDYTSNGTAVTLLVGAEAGDILSVGTFVDLGEGFAVDSFTANGSNTQFSLSRTPSSGAALLVSFDGLKQHQTEYTLSGSVLTFNEAPPANVSIEVTHMGNAPIATVSERWAEISGNATAAPGYKYIVNTAAVPAFINLPPNPRLGDTVYFLDGTSSFDTKKLTILRNGSKIMGQFDNFESDTEDSYFGFVYFNVTYGWRLLN